MSAPHPYHNNYGMNVPSFPSQQRRNNEEPAATDSTNLHPTTALDLATFSHPKPANHNFNQSIFFKPPSEPVHHAQEPSSNLRDTFATSSLMPNHTAYPDNTFLPNHITTTVPPAPTHFPARPYRTTTLPSCVPMPYADHAACDASNMSLGYSTAYPANTLLDTWAGGSCDARSASTVVPQSVYPDTNCAFGQGVQVCGNCDAMGAQGVEQVVGGGGVANWAMDSAYGGLTNAPNLVVGRVQDNGEPTCPTCRQVVGSQGWSG